MTTFEAASMKALVPVTIIIAVVGVVATVMDMINKIGDQKGAPFGCSSNWFCVYILPPPQPLNKIRLLVVPHAFTGKTPRRWREIATPSSRHNPRKDVNLDPLFRLARQPVERRDHFLLEERRCS